MTIMILERVAPSVRGDLSRWLIEVKAGVFLGRISRLVRDKLWERALKLAEDGTVIQAWTTNTEQGFDMRYSNPKGRVPIQVEDIWLVQVVDADPRRKP